MTQDAFAKATGTADKESFLIPNATHIQTYYVPEYVDTAAFDLGGFVFPAGEVPAPMPSLTGTLNGIELPKLNIKGNTHFLMQDLNNDVIAKLFDEWMSANRLK